MGATAFHSEQIVIFSDQLSRYFAVNEHIHIGVDNFIYYREGDMRKCVSPDVYVVLGADKYPLRAEFLYLGRRWPVPTAVFEFLSDSTANRDRYEKAQIYFDEIGVQEYFIHQPEKEKPSEFSWVAAQSLGCGHRDCAGCRRGFVQRIVKPLFSLGEQAG